MQVLPGPWLSRPALILSFILSSLLLANLTGDLEDGLGESLHVAGGDTGNGDTTVLGGVDGVLDKPLAVFDTMGWDDLTSLARASICSGFRPV